jgi:hypothetical protein
MTFKIAQTRANTPERMSRKLQHCARDEIMMRMNLVDLFLLAKDNKTFYLLKESQLQQI